LPGVALAFLLTQSKAPLVLVIGAAIAGWVGTLLVMSIVNNTRIKEDTALGLVLSVFFGAGLVLLTFIQKMPTAKQSGLDTFLFGQAAALMERDVITMVSLGGIILIVMQLFWKEFKLLCFDSSFGASLGFPMRILDVLLITLLVVAIVLGLQTVGVVLMSAMIVAPAAAARQWTDRLGAMVAFSALFGAIAGVSGAAISSSMVHMPTGPAIVLCISAIVVVSIAIAPNRGIVWNWIRNQRERRKLQIEVVLKDLYALASQHADLQHSHSIAVLGTMSVNRGNVRNSLKELASRGWVKNVSSDEWALTPEGVVQAQQIANRER
jgi:manganese/zinc/iron transport system permease protein